MAKTIEGKPFIHVFSINVINSVLKYIDMMTANYQLSVDANSQPCSSYSRYGLIPTLIYSKCDIKVY